MIAIYKTWYLWCRRHAFRYYYQENLSAADWALLVRCVSPFRIIFYFLHPTRWKIMSYLSSFRLFFFSNSAKWSTSGVNQTDFLADVIQYINLKNTKNFDFIFQKKLKWNINKTISCFMSLHMKECKENDLFLYFK